MAEEKTSKKVAKEADASKANKKKSQRKNPFKSIASFFKGVNAERKKVVWPTGKETIKNSIIVLIVVLIVGLAIYGVDTVLSLGMKGLKSLKTNETTVSETAEDPAAALEGLLGESTTGAEAEADTTAAAE